MKIRILFILLAAIVISCTAPSEQKDGSTIEIEKDTLAQGQLTYLELSDPLDKGQVAEGKAIFEQRCDNCHRLDSIKLVGPGWEGITNRRTPEWIMNMIINVNIMVEQDSIAHQLFKDSQVKMPDQHLAVDKARSLLEFMRQNDLDKLGVKDEGDEKSR